MRPLNGRNVCTRAKRKLVSEADILTVKYRIELGVLPHTACRLLLPGMSGVAAMKLVRWHTEMEEALANEDFVLFDCIYQSLFPIWVQQGEEQPSEQAYFGQFPYGHWGEFE